MFKIVPEEEKLKTVMSYPQKQFHLTHCFEKILCPRSWTIEPPTQDPTTAEGYSNSSIQVLSKPESVEHLFWEGGRGVEENHQVDRLLLCDQHDQNDPGCCQQSFWKGVQGLQWFLSGQLTSCLFDLNFRSTAMVVRQYLGTVMVELK